MRKFVSSALVVLLVATFARAADTYKIDPVHAVVLYRVSHFDIGNAYGRFNEPTGTVMLDTADASKSSFTFEVDANKVDTGNPKRDQHLKSPDFFDVANFPKITFKSTSVKSSDGKAFEVTGDLNLHGVTKSVTFTINKTGEADVSAMKMGYRTGWEAQVDLKRTDYGMKTMVGPVGDDVHLVISFEAVKQ